MAAALLREISQDEHERARLRSRRMYETDMISDRLTSEEIGEIRGIAKGRVEGELRVIALLKRGFSLEEIEKTLAIGNEAYRSSE